MAEVGSLPKNRSLIKVSHHAPLRGVCLVHPFVGAGTCACAWNSNTRLREVAVNVEIELARELR